MNHPLTDLLSQKEKRDSIDFILTQAMPQKQSTFAQIQNLYHTIGFKGLFFGMEDITILTALSLGVLWVPILAGNITPSFRLLLLFITAPFAYASLHYLCIWKQVQAGTFALLSVMKLSLHQLTILRMLVFGGFSVVVTTVGSIAISLHQELSFLQASSVGCAGLFLFASLQILLDGALGYRFSGRCVPVLWVLMGVAFWKAETSFHFLLAIPPLLTFAIAGGCFVFYLATIHHAVKGVPSYAYRF